MSQITENTIVVKREDSIKAMRAIEKFDRVSNIKSQFSNNELEVFIFDMNGVPQDIYNVCCPIILETCYGNEVSTEYNGKTSRYHAPFLLKKHIQSREVWEDICKKIQYSGYKFKTKW